MQITLSSKFKPKIQELIFSKMVDNIKINIKLIILSNDNNNFANEFFSNIYLAKYFPSVIQSLRL